MAGARSRRGRSGARRPDDVAFGVFAVLVVLLCAAGGASSAEVLGQAVVRTGALLVVAALVGFGSPLDWRRYRAVAMLLGASATLATLQLVPLPPSVWSALPGRELFAQGAALAGVADAWRPIALAPDGALNALFSLCVPAAAFIALAALRPERDEAVLALLTGAVFLSAVVGLLQLTGGGSGSPFVNGVLGQASGVFANRNHQALFLALGILFALGWASDGSARRWRLALALALGLLFALMILATGSRAGLLLGALATGLGLAAAWRDVRRVWAGLPRRERVVVAALGVGGLILVGAFAADGDRARSIARLFELQTGADLRSRALPVLVDLLWRYFPVGSGLGSFDPVFRSAEPLALLKPSYFNHAHNDFVEIALETGVFGAGLLLVALLWWARASWRHWGGKGRAGTRLGRIGAAAILLILIASALDYPARTPIVMAVLVVAGCWTAGRERCGGGDRGGREGDAPAA